MTQRLRFHGRHGHGFSSEHPIPLAIANTEEFTAGNMRGVSGGLGHYWPTGRLPEPWRSRFDQADRDNQIAYVVYSYQTPIAWWTTNGHYVQPDVTYSATTSRHQRYSRLAHQPTNHTIRVNTPTEEPTS